MMTQNCLFDTKPELMEELPEGPNDLLMVLFVAVRPVGG